MYSNYRTILLLFNSSQYKTEFNLIYLTISIQLLIDIIFCSHLLL